MGKGSRLRQRRQTAIGSIDRDQRRALQKIIDDEVTKSMVEWDARFWNDIVVSVLWALHEACGFGPVRLKKFYRKFDELHIELRERYENTEINNGWICRQKLKDLGVDVEAWDAEAQQLIAERNRT